MFADELKRASEEWLVMREAEGISPATVQAYRDHLHIFLLWLDVRELVPFTFAAFFRDYAKARSPASCRTIYTSMAAFLRGVGRADLIGSMKKPRGIPPPKAAYTEGEMRVLFHALRANRSATGQRDYAIVCLLRYCGLRATEACGLVVDDLVEDDVIVIRGGKSRYARRRVPLIRPCPEALAIYLGRGRPQLVQGRSDHVFLSTDGAPLTRHSLRQMLRRRSEQVGFPLSAHRFRHTWATAHVRARTSPTAIGHLAGWSPKTLYEMLQTYGHPDLEDLRAAQKAAFGH